MKMQFEHIGIVTTEKKAGESFVPVTRVWRTDFQKHPFRVEWLRAFVAQRGLIGKYRGLIHLAAGLARRLNDFDGRV